MEHHYYFYIGLALVSLLVAVFTTNRRASVSGQQLPPGPWQLPFIGSLHHVAGQLPHRAMRDLARRHGPVMLLRMGELPTVVLSSREAASEVMRTHDLAFASRPLNATVSALTNGGRDIIFAPYGAHWRQLRKVAITELLSARRVLSFRRVREEEVAATLRAVAAAAGGGGVVVEMRARLSALVTDVSARVLFGDRCKDRDMFLRQLEHATELAAGFNPSDLWPSSWLARRIGTSVRRAEECQKTVFRIVDGFIKEHLERMDNGGGAGEAHEDLLGVLLRTQRDGELQIPLEMDVVKSVMFVSSVGLSVLCGISSRVLCNFRGIRCVQDLFAGGSETSATALEWAMAELIRHPKAMERATAEVRRVFAGHVAVPEHALDKLRYLHLVIREALRLHPPLPLLLPRECQEPRRVLGYDVPRGTTVFVNAWALGRDERYWPGGDSEDFRPERFEEKTAAAKVGFKGSDFEFLPFGAGRRMCPGMLFGLANVELPLASLLFHFDWEASGEIDMTESFGVTVRRKAGLQLRPIVRIPVP
jgi:cytochrome P450